MNKKQFYSFCGYLALMGGVMAIDSVLSLPTQQEGVECAWVQLALLAASVASSIYGAKKSSDAAKKQKAIDQSEKAKEDALLRRKRNEAYADTAAGQRLLTQAKEFNKENWKKAQGAAKVGGASDASVAMAKEQGNKMMANTLANMAASDTARQDRADYAQIESDRQYARTMANLEAQRAANTAAAASQASNAMMSAASAFDSGQALSKNVGNDGYKAALADANAGKAVAEMKPVASNDLDEAWKRRQAGLLK